MKFIELVLQNFGPYFGKQVINLDTQVGDDDSRPIILLGGMNGGGKTTLMDALRLALYGHRADCSSRGSLSYGDFLVQCINNQAKVEDTRVELVFEHIENNHPIQYRIIRTWNRNLKEGKDSLGIFNIQDDTWNLEELVNTWDDYIENLLPLGISNLFLFDGEQIKELAEQEVPPLIVTDAIRALLGLELAEKLAIDIEILANRKRKEFAETKDLENLEEIEARLKLLQEDYQKIQDVVIQYKTSLTEAEKAETEAFNKFASEGGKIAAEKSQLERQRDRKVAEVEEIRQGMCEIAANVLPLALVQNLLNQAQTQGEKEFQIQQAQIASDLLLERDKRLLDLIAKLNITPEQAIKIETFLSEDITTLNANLIQAEEFWLLADAESLGKLGNILYYLQNARNLAQQQLNLLKNKADEIIGLERQVETAASPEEYNSLVDMLKITQQNVINIKAKYTDTQKQVSELEAEIEKTKKELKDYTTETIDRKNSQHIITASARVKETLKVFREKLTLRKLNKLEIEVTECFRYLLHKSNLVHRVAIETYSFSLSLYDLQGKIVPKHRLSAGEKQLLAIAFLWGLARMSGRRLPIAIDTPLGRLDSSHRGNLIEKYFPSASHQVILLSTDTEIGKVDVKKLRENEVIAREYLLKYDSNQRQTTVIKDKYFF
ncbi:DNA sulfur modification protein DndD [Calothrix sp. PCC 6303]|uniref:DNA sulfur modification protein DndD n=1 Tax=Calothrix sp. PCC 6303 TaxID=1170562 RepID=UPI0002A026FF|nr:DNA sulfur modification protein DndD [Calothrix sp. PCC 6303]AFZ03872.1 DNA sulfur modification protein DndD [Calothrix sp. PCC 6303]